MSPIFLIESEVTSIVNTNTPYRLKFFLKDSIFSSISQNVFIQTNSIKNIKEKEKFIFILSANPVQHWGIIILKR